MLLRLVRPGTKDRVSSVVRVVGESSKVRSGVHVRVGESRVRVPKCNLARNLIWIRSWDEVVTVKDPVTERVNRERWIWRG